MGKMDTTVMRSKTGAKLPAGVEASDKSGERSGRKVGGVAMGKEDEIGADKEFNTGRTEGICYDHKRNSYGKEDKFEKKM